MVRGFLRAARPTLRCDGPLRRPDFLAEASVLTVSRLPIEIKITARANKLLFLLIFSLKKISDCEFDL